MYISLFLYGVTLCRRFAESKRPSYTHSNFSPLLSAPPDPSPFPPFSPTSFSSAVPSSFSPLHTPTSSPSPQSASVWLTNVIQILDSGLFCDGTRRYGVPAPFFQVKKKILCNVYF